MRHKIMKKNILTFAFIFSSFFAITSFNPITQLSASEKACNASCEKSCDKSKKACEKARKESQKACSGCAEACETSGSKVKNTVYHKNEDIKFDNFYVRATAVKMTAAFLDITNSSSIDDKLVSASTDVAGKVELHTHLMEDGVAMMRQVDSIALPAKATVNLKPRGLHIMLMQMKKPLQDGEEINITLSFEHAGDMTISFPVKKK